jgi:outer membrane protein TolC
VAAALQNDGEVRRLEARLLAKQYDIRAERAERLPKLDLVAQYALLSKFNNYEEFFRRFQRNNGQLGVSAQFPIWTGTAVNAATNRAEAEAAQLRVQISSARKQAVAEARRSFGQLEQAQSAREVARLELEVARDQVSVLLAQMQEGRAALRQVEQARAVEAERWMALYDALSSVEKARLALLRDTGQLIAVLR